MSTGAASGVKRSYASPAVARLLVHQKVAIEDHCKALSFGDH